MGRSNSVLWSPESELDLPEDANCIQTTNISIMNNDWQLECIGIRNRGAHILKTGEFSDCTFTVGSEQSQVKISAHKIILAMASPVFQAMFYGSIIETSAVIAIVDIEADIFKSLLVYIYTDEIDVESFEKAIELYYAAKKYMLPHLTQECVKYLSSKLCVENALVLYEFAKFNDNEDLMDLCIQMIQKCAKDVITDSSFTDASLETVCTVFSMDPLNIDSELDLFAAAERYLKANKECAVPPVNNEPLITDDRYLRPRDTSPSELNMSSSALHLQLGDAKARSKARFQFTVHNIGTVDKYVHSPPFYVRNLPWKIVVGPENILGPDSQYHKTLGTFLECNAESESTCWSCYAKFSLRVICHKPKTKSIWTRSQQLFHSKENEWGCSGTITWNDLMDPEKGYVKDDSITIQAYVSADAPHGILGNSVKHTSLDHRDKLTIRNVVRLIRFLTLTPEQFAEGATKSTLLDKTEEHAIFINLLSKRPNTPMPLGFCPSTQKRKK